MILYDKILSSSDLPDTAVALGLFDGVHRGHQAVIQGAVDSDFLPGVFSFRFDRHAVITKKQYGRILSPELKRERLLKMGVRFMLEPSFSSIMTMQPEAFIHGVLFNFCHAKALFCGEDFRFGKNAEGDVALLEKCCREEGVRLTIVPPVLEGGMPVSSTRIRSALREGDVALANRLLGFPYMTSGEVVHGRHLGATLGFPTINQLFSPDDLIPRFGVYATLVTIDGKKYVGATDIGVKPTVGEGYAPAAETYILDFNGDMYGRKLTLSYHAFLRGEKKFASLEELTATVLDNAETARELLADLI